MYEIVLLSLVENLILKVNIQGKYTSHDLLENTGCSKENAECEKFVARYVLVDAFILTKVAIKCKNAIHVDTH